MACSGGDGGLELVAAGPPQRARALEQPLRPRRSRSASHRERSWWRSSTRPPCSSKRDAAAGVLDGEQRGQPPRLGLLGHGGGDHAGQPHGVRGQVAVLGGAGRGDEALVEHHVDDGEHVGEPVRELVGRRDGQRDAGLDDLALGADDPLRERALVDQERAGDLRRGEADHRAEGERQPGLGGQGRVAAGEQQREPVVGAGPRAAAGGWARAASARCRVPRRTPSRALRWAATCSQAAGLRGGPSRRQRGERLDDGRLDRLLGQVEVAEAPRQPGHQRTSLLAQRLREETVRLWHRGRYSNCE